MKIHSDLSRSGVGAQLVLYRELQMRRHALQHAVEIVRVDLNEFAILQGCQRLLRLSGKIAQHTHHEGQFLHLDGVSNLYVVSDLHPGSPDATKLLLCTCLLYTSILRLLLRGRPNYAANLQQRNIGPVDDHHLCSEGDLSLIHI